MEEHEGGASEASEAVDRDKNTVLSDDIMEKQKRELALQQLGLLIDLKMSYIESIYIYILNALGCLKLNLSNPHGVKKWKHIKN